MSPPPVDLRALRQLLTTQAPVKPTSPEELRAMIADLAKELPRSPLPAELSKADLKRMELGLALELMRRSGFIT